MSHPQLFEKLRPLGRLEQHASTRHALGFYNNVATSAYYSNSTFTGSLQALIYRALAAVVASHPSLSAIVVDEDTEYPVFARLPRIDLREAVTFIARKHAYSDSASEDKELDEVLEAQHNRNFQERFGELPFWRLVILHETEGSLRFVACFVHHHAIGDGTSGFAFHRSLQVAISAEGTQNHGFPSDGELNTVVEPPKSEMLPPVDAILPLNTGIRFTAKALWRNWFPKNPAERWTGLVITDSNSMRKTCFKSFSLSQEHAAKLRAAARKNSTTVTAVAETILAASVFIHLPEEFSMLQCSGPISMRRYLPSYLIDNNSMGDFVSRYLEVHRRPSKSITAGKDNMNAFQLFSWDEVRRVKRTINAELNLECNNTAVGLLRYVNDFHKFFTGKVGKPREDSFEFSNVGVFQSDYSKILENDDKWTIGKVVFSQCADVVGAAFECSVASGGDGQLSMAFSWLEGIVESQWMETIIQEFKGALQELVERE